MAGTFSSLSATCDWLVPQSTGAAHATVDRLEVARQEFILRVAQRADLSDFDRTTVINLGTAILQSDFGKLQAILKSYRHYAEQFACLAYILACDLRCPEISILKVSVIQWKAGGVDSERKVCVLTLRLDKVRRFIDIATEPNYGVHVFAVTGDGLFSKLTRVSEDPQTILKQVATAIVPAPESIFSAWWN
jgi:hypothetical protein